eukprot:9496954-Pyramimonas_sp.AAC.1
MAVREYLLARLLDAYNNSINPLKRVCYEQVRAAGAGLVGPGRGGVDRVGLLGRTVGRAKREERRRVGAAAGQHHDLARVCARAPYRRRLPFGRGQGGQSAVGANIPSPLVRLVRPAGICPLPSSDWSALRVYTLSPRPIGPPCGYIPSPLVRLALRLRADAAFLPVGAKADKVCGRCTKSPCRATLWMLRAIVWMLRAIVW